MEFLSGREKFDLKAIINDQFIVGHWNLIEKLAASDNTVNLYVKRDNGESQYEYTVRYLI